MKEYNNYIQLIQKCLEIGLLDHVDPCDFDTFYDKDWDSFFVNIPVNFETNPSRPYISIGLVPLDNGPELFFQDGYKGYYQFPLSELDNTNIDTIWRDVESKIQTKYNYFLQ